MLADYTARKRHATVNAKEFQSLVESFHGAPLEDLFNKHVYAGAATPVLAAEEGDEAANPHRVSIGELLNEAFPAS